MKLNRPPLPIALAMFFDIPANPQKPPVPFHCVFIHPTGELLPAAQRQALLTAVADELANAISAAKGSPVGSNVTEEAQ